MPNGFTSIETLDPFVRKSVSTKYDKKRIALAQHLGLEWPASHKTAAMALLDHLFYVCVDVCRRGDHETVAEIKRNMPQFSSYLHDTWRMSEVAALPAQNCLHLSDATFLSPVYVYDFITCPQFSTCSSVVNAVALANELGFKSLISSGLGAVVIIKGQESLQHLESYTVTALQGTIFLEASQSVLRNAETIVHESAHNWLNGAFTAFCEPLPTQPSWWSPWRGVDRPAAGILHGIFAFACVVEFLWTSLVRGIATGNDSDYAIFQIRRQTARLALLKSELPEILQHLRSERLQTLFSNLFERSLYVGLQAK